MLSHYSMHHGPSYQLFDGSYSPLSACMDYGAPHVSIKQYQISVGFGRRTRMLILLVPAVLISSSGTPCRPLAHSSHYSNLPLPTEARAASYFPQPATFDNL